MKEFWNERYAVEEYVYGKIPNDFFRQFIDREPPGSILLASEGEGRNAVYAASRGWEVSAVDFSEVARKKALLWAKENRVHIHYDVSDISDWNTEIQFDCVSLIYAHFHVDIRKSIHEKLLQKLKPGGKIVLEAFSKEQLNFNSGGPRSTDLLYDSALLRNDFTGMDIEFLQEKVIDLDEGDFHRGKASIVQMIAKLKES
jgi:SAM-dependent methyltransferase